MTISNNIRSAINLCLRHSIPFVAYAFPSERRLKFRTSLGERDCTDCDYFFVNTFASSLSSLVKIPFIADEYATIEALAERPTDLCMASVPEMPEPTTRSDYRKSLETVIERLKANGGKTVISRVICGDAAGIDWIEFAHRYFSRFPFTYRFIYYTPQTGAWIVASPELLFSHDKISATSHTMALAGTRKKAGDTPWDEKNINEQKIVSEYIWRKLTDMGLDPQISDTHSSQFGEIEHLCSSFDMFGHKLSDEESFAITDALNPTPAVAGYPVDKAIHDINDAEIHSRQCYGGYIGIADQRTFTAIVNLRSLRFSGTKYCIFAGGGIMPQSDIEQEWAETEYKSMPARELINGLIE